ncbi:D-alanyl-D-alanine dipeptidase [Tumidithrix elongata RA019]|uniref:D-alanyl-D-alanine dipeptidase n=1 Tax=Tumidithrix elongata BACA0141 TaxID=2716417 RepID=A0AAW9Q3U8_9CYAN|nr:D-alanyl-D-alanine dipeptidase [Tumidithrix elongata RA019]
MTSARRRKRWAKHLSSIASIAIFCLFPACQSQTQSSESGSNPVPMDVKSEVKPEVKPTAISAKPSGDPEPMLERIPSSPAQLVDLQAIDPRIRLDIRYATTNNFLKQKVYPVSRCLLRWAAAEKLIKAQTELAKQGLGLKVYDCYRPLSVQKQMWQVLPDDRYVANPANGSRHNRASAVDLTLVDRTGKELEMPSGFDDFSQRSHLGYQGGSQAAQKNRRLLVDTMQRHGFLPIQTEWWHFDVKGWQDFPILDIPLDAASLTVDRSKN